MKLDNQMKTRQVPHTIFTAWNIRVHDLQWAVDTPRHRQLGRCNAWWPKVFELRYLKVMDLSWMSFVCSFACLGKIVEDSNWHGVLWMIKRWWNSGKYLEYRYIYIHICIHRNRYIYIYVYIYILHTCLRWTHCYAWSRYMCNLNLSDMISQCFYCFASLGIPFIAWFFSFGNGFRPPKSWRSLWFCTLSGQKRLWILYLGYEFGITEI